MHIHTRTHPTNDQRLLPCAAASTPIEHLRLCVKRTGQVVEMRFIPRNVICRDRVYWYVNYVQFGRKTNKQSVNGKQIQFAGALRVSNWQGPSIYILPWREGRWCAFYVAFLLKSVPLSPLALSACAHSQAHACHHTYSPVASCEHRAIISTIIIITTMKINKKKEKYVEWWWKHKHQNVIMHPFPHCTLASNKQTNCWLV